MFLANCVIPRSPAIASEPIISEPISDQYFLELCTNQQVLLDCMHQSAGTARLYEPIRLSCSVQKTGAFILCTVTSRQINRGGLINFANFPSLAQYFLTPPTKSYDFKIKNQISTGAPTYWPIKSAQNITVE